MNYEEFVEWTTILVELGRLTLGQAEDVREQRQHFDEQRLSLITGPFGGLVVGFIAGEQMIAEDTVGLLDRAVRQYQGERQLYFEQIPVMIET